MADSVNHCPKCGEGMEAGYLPDASYSSQVVGRWAPGSPKKNFWSKTEIAKETVPIRAFRCAGCGFLELYARDEFAAQ